eukprot:2246354-Lingulodinium_polyedra.AAC.1
MPVFASVSRPSPAMSTASRTSTATAAPLRAAVGVCHTAAGVGVGARRAPRGRLRSSGGRVGAWPSSASSRR